MMDNQPILRFISRFKGSEDVFLHGCCYWFAWMLHARFWTQYDVTVLYEPVEGHFVTRIEGRYYDARGDVTGRYRDKPLYSLTQLSRGNSERFRHLMRDCRDFEEAEE